MCQTGALRWDDSAAGSIGWVDSAAAASAGAVGGRRLSFNSLEERIKSWPLGRCEQGASIG